MIELPFTLCIWEFSQPPSVQAYVFMRAYKPVLVG